ncbi:hypothetical protein TGDOM2_358620 [Toxoplasma gondii GAB2-2007-GAL-DOM2]|uniref:Uncharacterized protein n=1 Tax=Toxoplasma gondii GAB2-2007-GAL-DOM2 TaxID=1130820 RepID=A0A086KN64_TOXGO|nr:hypothetical protein TGDOM2_358620 [Toxoplasma gondii GAB2-2007-GAL-DOM2]
MFAASQLFKFGVGPLDALPLSFSLRASLKHFFLTLPERADVLPRFFSLPRLCRVHALNIPVTAAPTRDLAGFVASVNSYIVSIRFWRRNATFVPHSLRSVYVFSPRRTPRFRKRCQTPLSCRAL